jgi:hypothetical protein
MGLAVAPGSALAASTVRGKLFRQNSAGQSYGAAGIPVRLVDQGRGPSARSYSGSDGMFYIYNVPPGNYTLEVFTNDKQPLRYSIRVLDKPYTDIAPIRVP